MVYAATLAFFFLNAKYLNKQYVTIPEITNANACAISDSIIGGIKSTFSKYVAKTSSITAFTRYPTNHVERHLKYCLYALELLLALKTKSRWVVNDKNEDKNQANANVNCLTNRCKPIYPNISKFSLHQL